MKILLLTCWLVTSQAFLPVTTSPRATTTLEATKNKKSDNDWLFTKPKSDDLLSQAAEGFSHSFDGIHQFFDKLTGVKETKAKKEATTTTLEEKPVVEEETEEGTKHDDSWIAEEMETIAVDVVAAPETTTPEPMAEFKKEEVVVVEEKKKTTSKESSTDYWIAQDMMEAGKGESETDDWVAKDMERLGRDVDHVKHDLKYDLETSSKTMSSKHAKKTSVNKKSPKEKEFERIEKDMKSAGRNVGTSSDIRDDMEKMGGKKSMTYEEDKTLRAMNKQKKTKYDDVYEDMRKTGMATSQEWVEQDMIHTGEAHSREVHSDGVDNNYSYKFDKVQDIVDHYDVAEIEKDIKQASKSTNQEWIRHDMEEAGKSHVEHVHGTYQRQDGFGKNKNKPLSSYVPSDIRQDMEQTGKFGSDKDAWIVQDMEQAGHADVTSKSSKDYPNVKAYRNEEVNEVMSKRKSILVEGPENKKEGDDDEVASKKKKRKRLMWERTNVRKSILKHENDDKKTEEKTDEEGHHGVGHAVSEFMKPFGYLFTHDVDEI